MDKPLRAALAYVPRWLDYQMRLTEQPGCALAVVHKGRLVLEEAFGHADKPADVALTPRHRFRVASHSKTFTAVGILKLREQGRLLLDAPLGSVLEGLHPQVARVTIAQLLSHGAGLVRDGADSGQWSLRRPFLSAAEVRADLAAGPSIEANTRFKYSNHGYALLGMVVQALTGESYVDWITREVIEAAGLHETRADAPLPAATPLASGHSAKLPLGRRVALASDMPTHALAAATGFVSSAADLARFYASLAPTARRSVLSMASRRELARRQWRDLQQSQERWYGLGTICGSYGGWDWFGHTGGFPGHITRTLVVPEQQLAVSVLTNAADGPSHLWLDGVLHILQTHARHGAPSRRSAPWCGRWWTLWGALDLAPMGERVIVANPAQLQPYLDASEIEPAGRATPRQRSGRIVAAGGFGSVGEPVRLLHDASGRAREFWLAGARLLPEAQTARELAQRDRPA